MLKIKFYFTLILFLINLFQINGQNISSSDEYRAILEDYLGYYIDRHSTPDNIRIVKLSFQDHLIVQKIFIENNEIVEGDRIVLEQIINYGWGGIIIFVENGVEYVCHSHNPNINFVTYNPSEENTGAILRYILNINYPSEKIGSINWLNKETSFFTKNDNEVIDIIYNRLFFPSDWLTKYTGSFVFYEYEIVDIRNMEIPFSVEEIRNDKIIVETDRQYLVSRHISTYHANWCIMTSIRNDQVTLGGVNMDGDNWFHSIRIYFIDHNTIIYDDIRGRLIDNIEERINYKVVFRREGISE